jgi:hypothetical protein
MIVRSAKCFIYPTPQLAVQIRRYKFHLLYPMVASHVVILISGWTPIMDASGHFPQAFRTFNTKSVLRLTEETVVCNVLLVIEILILLLVRLPVIFSG